MCGDCGAHRWQIQALSGRLSQRISKNEHCGASSGKGICRWGSRLREGKYGLQCQSPSSRTSPSHAFSRGPLLAWSCNRAIRWQIIGNLLLGLRLVHLVCLSQSIACIAIGFGPSRCILAAALAAPNRCDLLPKIPMAHETEGPWRRPD
jgi:hypothetical protein